MGLHPYIDLAIQLTIHTSIQHTYMDIDPLIRDVDSNTTVDLIDRISIQHLLYISIDPLDHDIDTKPDPDPEPEPDPKPEPEP